MDSPNPINHDDIFGKGFVSVGALRIEDFTSHRQDSHSPIADFNQRLEAVAVMLSDFK
jgi:hypothetical protein